MSELKSGSGDVVSRAGKDVSDKVENDYSSHTSAVIELRGDADAGSVLGGKRKVGLTHGGIAGGS